MTPGKRMRQESVKKVCQVEDCTNKIHARQMCAKHYQHDRAIRNGAAQCRRRACTSLAVFDGLCRNHYEKRKRKDEQHELRNARPCSVPGCPRPYHTGGYCQLHYGRVRKTGTPGGLGLRRAENGLGHVSSNGYRYFRQRDGSSVAEHRQVMEEHLGRKLLPNENIHHRNGLRADNRLENLELWVTPQAIGQRVEDLVRFVVDAYPQEVWELLSLTGRVADLAQFVVERFPEEVRATQAALAGGTQTPG